MAKGEDDMKLSSWKIKGCVSILLTGLFTRFLIPCIVSLSQIPLAVAASQASPQVEKASLPSLNADISKTTISGLSSGAFMAVQMHVAHSATFKGIGVFAGGPYFCSEGKFENAVKRCMTAETLPNAEDLAEWTKTLAKTKKIDPVENLTETKVWLLSGTADKTVHPPVVKVLKDYYAHFIVKPENIFGSFDLAAGHALITENQGNDCSDSKLPFINQCKYDGAGKLLSHLYGELTAPSDKAEGEIIEFDQNEFVDNKGVSEISMAEKGYVYVPQICKKERCGVHVFLHGCKQYAELIGKQVIEQGGFNRWADTNKLIILYPQTIAMANPHKSKDKQNPFGCWDWWGYSDSDFYSKDAPQIKAIMEMVNRLVKA